MFIWVHTLHCISKHQMNASWKNMFIGFIICTVSSSVKWMHRKQTCSFGFILCTVSQCIKWMHPERTCSYGSSFALYLQAFNDCTTMNEHVHRVHSLHCTFKHQMIALRRKWYNQDNTALCPFWRNSIMVTTLSIINPNCRWCQHLTPRGTVESRNMCNIQQYEYE